MAMSASGSFLPPAFVFPRARMNDVLKLGAPENSLFLCHPSGWSNSHTCSLWFEHFLQHVKPSAERPVLLILDGHASHTKNISFLERANENNVKVISIPPHTSHKLQPLDVAVMGPLKKYYSQAMDSFMKQNLGKAVSIQNVASLVNEAFLGAATIKNAMSGFLATGICPFNENIFSDADFAASKELFKAIEKQASIELINFSPPSTDAEQHVDEVPQESETDVNVTLHNTKFILSSQSTVSSLFQPVEVCQIDQGNQPDHDPDASYILIEVNDLQPLIMDSTSDELTLPIIPDLGDVNDFENVAHDEVLELDPNTYFQVGADGHVIEITMIDQSTISNDPGTDHSVELALQENTIPSGSINDHLIISSSGIPEPVSKKAKNTRKRATKRKAVAEELTSTVYREQLKTTNATQTIKKIKKKGRKQPATEIVNDVLCFFCGDLFSASVNGNGWRKCLRCDVWFHEPCTGLDAIVCSSCV